MSAPIPQRTLQSAKFNPCVNALAEAFERNGGELTRSRFRQICAEHGYETMHPQAYFESAGLKVEKLEYNRGNGDRFVWRYQ